MAAFDLRYAPPLGLRVTASVVAFASLLWFAEVALSGRSVAPLGAALRVLPLALLGVGHALLLLGHAWGARLPPVSQAGSAWLVLLLGMVLVAGGTDSAFVQLDRFGWDGLSRGHGFWLGLLAVVQGALGVLLVWSRRPPAADQRADF